MGTWEEPEASEPALERISLPRVGDVIVCEAFANGWRRLVQPDVPEEGPIWVTDMKDMRAKMPGMPMRDYRDETRGIAAFVVESCSSSRHVNRMTWTESRNGGGYGEPFTYVDTKYACAMLVTARRLAADGGYDPEGECIQFEAWGEGPGNHGPGVRECLAQVRRSGNLTLSQTILDAPIYKLRTMSRSVRFD